ncbi:predicted protein [Plenodomus lingam JN3]|uniref:Predicted protein n=1 Tax=Leptosphaeria maculans (strain JN3 / isolate v23.1.3 / race Av1-4-5-6-7-8) TaxID=985895 RepID=E4ZSA8_LEPMJ|nr:predicted protein [Plenodomus lingam JN3]CBX94288.1 predicted protein [Plenodomus lingam JN3]
MTSEEGWLYSSTQSLLALLARPMMPMPMRHGARPSIITPSLVE